MSSRYKFTPVEGMNVRLRMDIDNRYFEGDTGVLRVANSDANDKVWGVVFDHEAGTDLERVVVTGIDSEWTKEEVYLIDFCDPVEPLPPNETLVAPLGHIDLAYGDPVYEDDGVGGEFCIDEGIRYFLNGQFPASVSFVPEAYRDNRVFMMDQWRVRCVGRTYRFGKLIWVVDLAEKGDA